MHARDEAAPAVLLVPGPTGVGALEPEAALLASHGYCALVAGYIQEEGLPPSLREIPVEAVLAAAQALAAHGRVEGERIGWIAASVGTQARSPRSPSPTSLGFAAPSRLPPAA